MALLWNNIDERENNIWGNIRFATFIAVQLMQKIITETLHTIDKENISYTGRTILLKYIKI